jgi:hypothetical protein
VSGDARPGVFIAWIHENSRSTSFARALGIRAELMPWAVPRQAKWTTIRGWVRSSRVTWTRVRSLPPGALAVIMIPPIWAPIVAAMARRRGVRLVFDMHSGARDGTRWAWSWPLLQWLMRRSADAVVVTNMEILDGADLGGCRPVVIVDPTLAAGVEAVVPSRPEGQPYCVFPASGEDDEPIDALAAAAAEMAGELKVVVTGRPPDRVKGSHLEITGYLSTDDYDSVLNGAWFVLALTTSPATNQRAASEAVQRGTPVVCSDTSMLRSVYGEAAVYAPNTPEGLTAAMRQMISERDARAARIPEVVEDLRRDARRGVETIRDL